MHGRILFGVVAWLLGAATATAGSLLAVSLLGQGITGGTGTLLSQASVNRALAREAAEPAATPTVSLTAGTALASPGKTRATASGSAAPSPSVSPAATGPSGTGPAGTAAADTPPPTPAASADGTSTSGGTVLTSHGGDVVASCPAGGAYLDSWSPAQGFVVGGVRRGPAQTARVTFDPATGSANAAVTMVVSCSAGIPSATTHTWTGDD
jgi:hypothetical protein